MFTLERGSAMGLFDGVLGGIVGAEMATVVNGLIERHGGLQGVISHLQSQGLETHVQSWVGSGPNQPVSPQLLHAAVGPDLMAQLAAKLGVPPEELAVKLSQVLPGAIDKLTPGGQVPAAGPTPSA
ncbi:MAG TPA: YidB family protein [Gemmatimonadaceae bacterium]|nr:YidB family protein [Gemmatimonadaceae bacterium]